MRHVVRLFVARHIGSLHIIEEYIEVPLLLTRVYPKPLLKRQFKQHDDDDERAKIFVRRFAVVVAALCGGRRRRKLLFPLSFLDLRALEFYDPRKKHTIKFPLIIAVALPSKRNMSSTLTEEQKRDRVQQVIGMGFSEEQAVTALQMADYDVNRAADLIVQGGK